MKNSISHKATKNSKIISSTLYRKYRPQAFADVFGQNEVVESLKKSIKNKSIAHAYIFAGSRGTGKTSIARIFSAEIGTNLEDIYEIDAASNRGIDQIRELREAVDTLPMSSPYKVYIIDEVHMLTKDAFNALLKTLEEPPKHVIFILATTEKEKVLPTVISRCQVFDFKLAVLDPLKELIKKIAKSEKRKIDNESIEFIAKLGDGSFRDALSYLQRVFTYFEKEIEFKELTKIFVISDGEIEKEFLQALTEKDKDKIYKIYAQTLIKDNKIELFIEHLLKDIRIALLIQNSKEFEKIYLMEEGKEKINFLKGLKNINSGHLKKILEVQELTTLSTNPRIAFEIFLFELFV